jgi:hypothetical protein
MKTLSMVSSVILASCLAQAQVYQFTASLLPSGGSATGTGSVTADYDQAAKTLQLSINFSGLSGNTSMVHIHGPTATAYTGTAGAITPHPFLPSFPAGVTSGSYSQTLDLTQTSSFSGAFVSNNGGTAAGAEAAMFAAMMAGKTYLNIHTTTFSGGEITGFLTPVPEPSTTCAVVAGLLGSFALVRRFRSASTR